jgi:hypothetical protein
MNKFEELVRRMRESQRDFFRTRSRESLAESKRLEKEVDKWLDEKTNTPDMFETTGT